MVILRLTFGGAVVVAAEECALHQIQCRLFSNGANSIACLYTQQGKKGTNQDAMIVWEEEMIDDLMETKDLEGEVGDEVVRQIDVHFAPSIDPNTKIKKIVKSLKDSMGCSQIKKF